MRADLYREHIAVREALNEPSYARMPRDLSTARQRRRWERAVAAERRRLEAAVEAADAAWLSEHPQRRALESLTTGEFWMAVGEEWVS